MNSQVLDNPTGGLACFIIAILIMGIAGGAIMPLVYGVLAKYTNNQYAYLILIPCYFFNVYYSRRGKRQAENTRG